MPFSESRVLNIAIFGKPYHLTSQTQPLHDDAQKNSRRDGAVLTEAGLCAHLK